MKANHSGSVIFGVCFLFLILLTLLLMIGLLVSARGAFMRYQFDGQIYSSMSIIFLVLIVASYALVSLWWLLFKFRRIGFHEIPMALKIGLLCGCIIGVLFCLALVFFNFFPQASGVLYFKGFMLLSIISVLPMLLVALMFLYIRQKH